MRLSPVFFFFLICCFTAPSQPVSVAEGSIPDGFRNIRLGMDVEAVKEALLEDPWFDYRGEPDVSFLPNSQDYLIECEGTGYVRRAYFQFYEKKLYILILVLNREIVDHYSLFMTLNGKYGEFASLSPSKVMWEFENTTLSLERPLSVKYIDKVVFEEIKVSGRADENLRDLSRSRFLDEF